MKKSIFLIIVVITTLIVAAVAYYISSPHRIAKTALSILSETTIEQIKETLVAKVGSPDQKEKLVKNFDQLVFNIKNDKYSDEHMKEILHKFDELENKTKIDSSMIEEFRVLIEREF